MPLELKKGKKRDFFNTNYDDEEAVKKLTAQYDPNEHTGVYATESGDMTGNKKLAMLALQGGSCLLCVFLTYAVISWSWTMSTLFD